jgi:hypothetical protein
MDTKKCRCCKAEKPLTSFYRKKASTDGFNPYCKPCAIEKIKIYREQNIEKIRLKHKAWRIANKEKIKENQKKWYAKNPNYQRESYLKNSNKRKEHSAKWRRENPEKVKEIRLKFKEKSRNQQYFRDYGITVEQYVSIVQKQGGGCAICGATKSHNGNRLAVDHCHDTGMVRGVLCDHCNRAIGLLGDTSEKIKSAFLYLKTAERKARVRFE